MTIRDMANFSNSALLNQVRREMHQVGQRIATGNRINSAADDAAGLGIATRMDARIRSLEQGINNAMDMRNLLDTADGGLRMMHEGLQIIRERVMQAGGLAGQTEQGLQTLQLEINQIMDGMGDIVRNTEFNTQRLLDGTFQNRHAAINADGSGMRVSINDASLNRLGHVGANQYGIEYLRNLAGHMTADGADQGALIGGFLQIVDQAISDVSGIRGNVGATINRIGFNIDNNQILVENTADARSRIRDANMPHEIMRMHQLRILETMNIMMMAGQMNRSRGQLGFIGIMFT